ncbi:MAG: 3'-5' exonuclease, partial [Acidobacteriota bacterium]
FPVESGVHPSFDVDADGTAAGECLDRGVESVLGEGYRRSEKSFDAESLPADVIVLAERRVGPVDVRKAAEDLVSDGVKPEAIEADPMGPGVVFTFLRGLFEDLDTAAPLVGALADIGGNARRTRGAAEFLRDLTGLERPETEDAAFTDLIAIDAWLRRQPDWAKNLDRLKTWASKDPGKGEKKFFEEASEDSVAALKRACSGVRWISKADVEAFGALRRVLHRILLRVEAEKRRKGILGFGDLLADAHRLLRKNRGVRERVRGEITQLLVDEMQDTDVKQAEIVRLLAFGEGKGPGLFLVGDPKQAIYSWRNADMAVYQRLVRDVAGRGGKVRSLTVNFRSSQEILDEVGRLVEPNMKAKMDEQPPYEGLLCRPGGEEGEEFGGSRTSVEHWCSAAVGDGGIPVKTSAQKAADLEAEAVARDAAALRAEGTPLKEMAILMRTRGQQAAYLEALKRNGVPYEVGRDPNFYRTREVIEVMALVRLVLDPFDMSALAAVLRTPFVGVPDVALKPLWRAGLPGCTPLLAYEDCTAEVRAVIDAAAAEVEGLPLETGDLEGLGRWPEVLEVFLDRLAALRRLFAEEVPDVFIERLRTVMAVEPLAACRFPGPYRLANIDRFFRELENMLGDGASADTILRHLRRVERERPDEAGGRPRSDAEGVRVLTIHGAKGLGFEHVWLVQTHAESRGPQGEQRTQVVKIDGRPEMSLRSWATVGFADVEAARKRTEEAERVRLLYVALTRAKKRLVTVGNRLPNSGVGPMLKSFGKRAGGWPEIEDLWPGGTQGPREDRDQARWVWLGHPRWHAETAWVGAPGKEGVVVDPARIEQDAEQLERWVERAQEHQIRPWLGTASEEAHRLFREALADRLEGAENEEEPTRGVGVDQRVAMAIGTAMHTVLERFDHEAEDSEDEFALRLDEALLWLKAALAREDSRERAKARLEVLGERFRGGALWPRFLGLDKSILARELPLVAAPGSGGAVGAVTGAIDLVYRDPVTGEIVVADYKTDRLESDDDIQDRAAVYQPQLQVYADALQEAMNLDVAPRKELWFLWSGVVVG